MTFALAVHSSKGGTGKTSIAVNLAAAYALDGKNVCLLDVDIRGPSLCSIFKPDTYFWINDMLSGDREIKDTIHDVSERFGTKGKFFVGYSNPDINQIRELARKDRSWQSNALKNIIKGKKELSGKNIDVIIFDTSPGVEYESINAVAASDIVLIVHNSSIACHNCTDQLIKGIYSPLNKQCAIVDNMCHPNVLGPSEEKRFGINVIAQIPCMCNVATRNNEILSLTDPDHVFSKAICSMKNKIEDFYM
ncbi:MinD/ParA family ATP-binding protein [Methanolobus halotolerans]|uniref:Chromosome partitioning protein n=1 Tax=Methanolobus halotolerans TaxID=2052935 RepID=A0A4E0QCJ4_9EURY|nr:MinD/ParA family protein [Methanolobus halotolerans]TGC10977.1 chromosome partitioning protein [Methanolobus halotolerans]